MNNELTVALIGAIGIILVAIITNAFTKNKELKFEERKLKEEYYTNYVKALSDNVLRRDNNKGLEDAQNKLILIGSSEVVACLMRFHDKIKISAPPLSLEEHDRLLTDLVKAMRSDLYGSKAINNGYPIVHLCGDRSDRDQGGSR